MPWAFWKLFTHSYTISLTKKSLQCCRANTLEVLCIPQIKASVIEKLIIFQNFKYLKNDHYFTPCKLKIKTSLIYAQMNRCLPLCWTIAFIFTREKCVTSVDSFCHCRDGFFFVFRLLYGHDYILFSLGYDAYEYTCILVCT